MNALALALLALEVKARAAIVEQIEKARTSYAGYLLAVIADGDVSDGLTLNSRADLHQALTMLLAAAQRTTEQAISAAYTAAVTVARNNASNDLERLGHDVTDLDTLNLGSTLTALTLDVDRAFAQTKTDIQNTVQKAFDGVQGSGPSVVAARQVAVNIALMGATNRLRLRMVAAATTSVYQGSRDAQTAVFQRYSTIHGYATVKKRWIVTSKNPCGMCRALHGTVVPLTSEFDRTANSGSDKLRPVYLDLQGPPRHPNCRCQIELVVT